MADNKREEYIYMAKLSEQTERFDEMVEYTKKLVGLSRELKDEERNLLSIAYKNYVSQRRTAWRAITAYETKEKNKNTLGKYAETIRYYKKNIEEEMEKSCNEIIQILDETLIKNSNQDAKIFYLKMRGDYYRYLCEFSSPDQLETYTSEAIQSYEEANQLLDQKNARKDDALRLGIALNYSVLYYEIKDDIVKACEIARKAFQEALNDLEDLEEERYKDSTTIMQLIRDNLTVWQNELPEGQDRNK
ncbi:14-3-3 family epsilon domain protein (macronuclear) [Tetrahymena thermophila SB210]|uniref:14-3-3 family epsilon domain protein n=1 Tax=Tetrahymena thermophila (strain SB210) TaxID=312017 RepID=Q232M6_TETTS|nr:14-3-3 family epsilon domain protein [Tetrahymena thermophila SB210]EAR91386.2 14-3-3 family epsilon domain protein [Tetrahymena thermophila SB210]|eukprot:XP_001011631.2 14-3-3 family epsilon domain protein [Tetrahymena thermophila SB210]